MSRGDIDESRGYHHGALRAALVEAAESLLAERGVEGFTLREAARRAGVSPAAPAHHFGSAAGLLTEVAADGFERLARALRAVEQAGGTPSERLKRQSIEYVRFAFETPGRFQLMFRRDLVDPENERLASASTAAMKALEDTVRDLHGLCREAPLDERCTATVLAAWSTVHGFAQLALSGKLAVAVPTAHGRLLEEVLPSMLQSIWSEPPPSPT